MKLSISTPATSSQIVLLASTALVLSAAMQLATTWLQTRAAGTCSCTGGALPSSPGFEQEYTWEGDDYPPYLPLDLSEPVALSIENSRHYAVDTPDADEEWHSVYPGDHFGFLRLGPNKRFFGLALYHQMHCLNMLRQAIAAPAPDSPEYAPHRDTANGRGHTDSDADADRGRDTGRRAAAHPSRVHASHCLNYLRETALCAADVTLEPEYAPGAQNVGQGLAVMHVCRDWSRVYAYAARNFEEWRVWAQARPNATASAPGS